LAKFPRRPFNNNDEILDKPLEFCECGHPDYDHYNTELSSYGGECHDCMCPYWVYSHKSTQRIYFKARSKSMDDTLKNSELKYWYLIGIIGLPILLGALYLQILRSGNWYDILNSFNWNWGISIPMILAFFVCLGSYANIRKVEKQGFNPDDKPLYNSEGKRIK